MGRCWGAQGCKGCAPSSASVHPRGYGFRGPWNSLESRPAEKALSGAASEDCQIRLAVAVRRARFDAGRGSGQRVAGHWPPAATDRPRPGSVQAPPFAPPQELLGPAAQQLLAVLARPGAARGCGLDAVSRRQPCGQRGCAPAASPAAPGAVARAGPASRPIAGALGRADGPLAVRSGADLPAARP